MVSDLNMRFKASKTLLDTFKWKCRIISRKKQHFLDMHENNVVINFSKAFLNVKHFYTYSQCKNDHICNTHQSEFSKEIHEGQTILVLETEKETEIVAQSLYTTTHSYTIMPTISKDGTLFSSVQSIS